MAQVSVTTGTPFEATHECSGCKTYSAGVAYGHGSATARMGFARSRDEAADIASLQSSERAAADALRIAALAKCPRCGRRNADAVASWALRHVLPIVIMTLFLPVVVPPLIAGGDISTSTEVLAAIAMFFGVRGVFGSISEWRGSTSRVHLEVGARPDW